MLLFSSAIHSNVGLKSNSYLINYKGLDLNYISSKEKSYSDRVNVLCRDDQDIKNSFYLVSEFLSSFAFGHDFRMLINPGSMMTSTRMNLADINGGYSEKKLINITELLDTFFYVPVIGSEEQSNLIRLYRKANTELSFYSKFLFFWHSIVYPNKDDKSAVNYIDNLTNEQKNAFGYSEELYSYISKKRPFLKKPEKITFGEYLRRSIRNSIGHIVREETYNDKNIHIDDYNEHYYMNKIVDFLKQVSRHRIVNDFNIEITGNNPNFIIKSIT